MRLNNRALDRVFRRMGLAQVKTLEQKVKDLFKDGSQSVWYDPSDTATLFQDAAGTTPVTAVEQPVGLMLDKSRGLVLGSELVTNGDFSSATGWSTEAGITIGGGVASFATTSNQVLYQTINATPGRFFQVTLTVVSYTSGTPQVSINGGAATVNIPNPSVLGVKTLYVISGSSDALLRIRSGTFGVGGTCVIDNISVRELPGYHAYHTPGDTTTRTTYSRRINLLTKTEQFDDAAWTKTNATVTADATTAPNGASTADKLVEDTANSTHYISGSTPMTVGVNCTASVCAKAGERTQLYINEAGVNGALFNLSTGVVVSATNCTASITPIGNSWYLCSWTKVAAYTNLRFGIGSGGNASYQGDGTSGIYIWGASLVPSDLASLPYQRVNTATDYDANPALFPAYLRCDGTNDGMQTNAIDFSATDKMFVSAGVRKLSDAAAGVLVEFGPTINSTNGAFVVTASPNNGLARYGFGTRGTASQAFAGSSPYSYPAPRTDILSGAFDHAALTVANGAVAPRVSGAAMPYATDGLNGTSAGNYGNHKLYLFGRGGTALPFNGWFYGAVIKGATLTAAQIATVERYNASKTKTVVLA